MKLNYYEILPIVRRQLAIDLNCSPDDFNKEGFIYCENKVNPGRRPFPRDERHFEMLTMGNSVIVSATPDILPCLIEQLDGKSRDEAFSMPFVYGQGLYFLPDSSHGLPVSDGFKLAFVEKQEIARLYTVEGFRNAIQYDTNHPRPDALAITAKYGDRIIGMAGASEDCEMMWQIGVDVLPEYRYQGLAAALTGMLADEILCRGKIPYYGTSSCNIASQRVAYRAGFRPAWLCVYRGRFGDVLTQPTG